MKPDQELVDELVRRIVAGARPLRIILFGSAARGAMGPDSDLDVLVVMPDGTDRLATAKVLHRRLRGLACAKDIVVVLDSDVHSFGDNPNLVIHPALTQGREIYHAA